MHGAFLLGSVLVVGLIVADWVAFTRNEPKAVRYGVIVGQHHESLLVRRAQFNVGGILALPRGAARLCPEQQAVMLLPDKRLLGLAFRTAWPINGAVHYAALEEQAPAMLIKRMPWSSVLLTVLWFLTVAVGMLVYLVAYALAGGFFSAGGAFLAVALSGLGLLVLLFGMVVVVAAYRLENKRLMALYEEFRDALHARETSR